MKEASHNVITEPLLQPLTVEDIHPRSAVELQEEVDKLSAEIDFLVQIRKRTISQITSLKKQQVSHVLSKEEKKTISQITSLKKELVSLSKLHFWYS